MLEFLKTSSGVYNLSFIITLIGWLIAGVGIFVGFHLNKVRASESQEKARIAIEERDKIQRQLDATTNELAKAKEQSQATADQVSYRIITEQQAEAFLRATRDSRKGKFIMKFRSGDDEAEQFAREIGSLLLDAGFEHPEGTKLTGVMNSSTVGVSIDVEDSKGIMDHGRAVIAGLRAIGIDAQPTKSRYQDAEGIISITVGLKPRNE